jgi:hypothetical protein
MDGHGSLKHYDEDARLRAQVDAEIAFGRLLEERGLSYDSVMDRLHVSAHQVNVVAHYLNGINDEQPVPSLLGAMADAGVLADPVPIAV